MSTDLLIVEDLSKKYSRNLKESVSSAAKDLIFSGVGIKRESKDLHGSEFWALKNINLSLKKGEVLAVMGHNGAGKSTLLKCIANKIKPDQGRIIINGDMGHLIEMSAGFDNILTGRENVTLRGRILGKKGKSLTSYVEAVKEFADINEFFDAPFQFYSSGMKSRLGFAASSVIEPEILIIDEVLAVGDLGFRLKCYERINELSRRCAVIFVSHSLGQVARMCNRGVYLEKGKILYDGGVQQALDLYQEKLSDVAIKKKYVTLNPELLSAKLLVGDSFYGDFQTKIDYGKSLELHVDISRLLKNSQIRVLLRDASGAVICDWNSRRAISEWPELCSSAKICLGDVELSPGAYAVSLEVMSPDGVEHLCLSEPIIFKVGGTYYSPLSIQRTGDWFFS